VTAVEAAGLIDAGDSLERQNEKLLRIVDVLMRRVQHSADHGSAGYDHFERAVMLEHQVRSRTRDLEEALDLLSVTNGRLNAAIREAEQARANLANAIEAVQEGFALFDPSDRLVMKNSRFASMVSDVASRIVPGLTFEGYIDLVSGSSALRLPPNVDRDRWRESRIAAHRRRSVHFNAEFENDHWIQVSEQRIADGGTAVVQTDVTNMVRLERQERQRLLDRQSLLLKATLDHIDQGIAIFDADTRLAGWNTRFQQLLKPPLTLLHPGTQFAMLAEFLATRSRFSEGISPLISWANEPAPRPALRLEVESGDGIVLDVRGQEMPNRSFLVSFTDVTQEREAALALQRANDTLELRVVERTKELRDARDAAERANRSKTRFVAAASHDLLQPLNAAKLYIASLSEDAMSARQQSIVTRLASAFGSIESLLNALLDISKLDSGKVALDLSAFPLERIFSTIHRDFQEVAARKGIDLIVVPSSIQVRSDPSYLRRIVQNLVSNAIRYTDSGKVLVGARRHGDMAQIVVQDTGAGISERDRESVFQEFRRLDRGPATAPGMGLGLAIVDRACKLLGHGLTLHSRVGVGTQFSVMLPRTDQEQVASSVHPSAAATGRGPTLKNLLVLVVDDDESIRDAISTLLERWGATPLSASGSAEALAVLTEIGMAPDVIIADYHLAGENGLEVIDAIRRQEGEVFAILISADRSPELYRLASERSVFLRQKPVDADEFATLLRGVRTSKGLA
jgi:signal transduction histidine kinase/CheY-like chemotaxis protein